MSGLSHVNEHGQPRMVDVSAKPVSLRRAVATGFIRMRAETCALVAANQIAKGNVLTCAEIAGVMGGKKTAELIPLCHLLPLDSVVVECRLEQTGVRAVATTICTGRTGVEMESLTAVSVALLTVYDMCKAVDKEMRIEEISLLEKTKKSNCVTQASLPANEQARIPAPLKS
ncbi:MAG: cyclic pyranopterin monophosphate synthase MoaC [Planctomycetota bacterium]